jgi:hypothetical protein
MNRMVVSGGGSTLLAPTTEQVRNSRLNYKLSQITIKTIRGKPINTLKKTLLLSTIAHPRAHHSIITLRGIC